MNIQHNKHITITNEIENQIDATATLIFLYCIFDFDKSKCKLDRKNEERDSPIVFRSK